MLVVDVGNNVIYCVKTNVKKVQKLLQNKNCYLALECTFKKLREKNDPFNIIKNGARY